MILYVNMATRDVAACASGDHVERCVGNRELDRVIDAGYTALADGDYYVSFSQMIGKASGIVGDARQTVAVPATARFEIRIPIEIIAVGALFGGISRHLYLCGCFKTLPKHRFGRLSMIHVPRPISVSSTMKTSLSTNLLLFVISRGIHHPPAVAGLFSVRLSSGAQLQPLQPEILEFNENVTRLNRYL